MECFYDTSLLYLWFTTGLVAGFTIRHFYSVMCMTGRPRQYQTYRPPVLLDECSDFGNVLDVLSDTVTISDEMEDLPPTDDISCDPENPDTLGIFCPGDRVVVVLSPDQMRPRFGWGGVSPGDVGVVHGIVHQNSPADCETETCYIVDFPNHPRWLALENELQKEDEPSGE